VPPVVLVFKFLGSLCYYFVREKTQKQKTRNPKYRFVFFTFLFLLLSSKKGEFLGLLWCDFSSLCEFRFCLFFLFSKFFFLYYIIILINFPCFQYIYNMYKRMHVFLRVGAFKSSIDFAFINFIICRFVKGCFLYLSIF